MKVILSIPVSKRDGEDKQIWGLNPKEIFTFKSAYQATFHIRKEEKGSSSSNSSEKDLWKYIWNLVIAKKMKTFIWKACLSLSQQGITYLVGKC